MHFLPCYIISTLFPCFRLPTYSYYLLGWTKDILLPEINDKMRLLPPRFCAASRTGNGILCGNEDEEVRRRVAHPDHLANYFMVGCRTAYMAHTAIFSNPKKQKGGDLEGFPLIKTKLGRLIWIVLLHITAHRNTGLVNTLAIAQ